MNAYIYQKEATGYSVWTASTYTGDRKDFVAYARSGREAQRLINRLHRQSAISRKVQ